MEIKIEKNIPMPSKTVHDIELPQPNELKVGDSFVIPFGERDPHDRRIIEAIRSKLRTRGIAMSTRTTDAGWRIWVTRIP